MIESVDIFPGSALAAAVGWDIAPNKSLLLLVLLAAAGAGVEAEVKSPNSACKPSRSEEAEEGMVTAAAAGCLTVALADAGLLPIRPSRSAEAEVEAGTLLGEGAVTGRVGSVLATAGLLVTGAVGLLAGKTTFFDTSAFALLKLLAASSPWSNPIGNSGGLVGCQFG